jgi:hypothetical protein
MALGLGAKTKLLDPGVGCARMSEAKDWFFLMGKSLLVLVGVVLVVGGLVELVVAGWTVRGIGALLVGLVLCVPPMTLAFRDAVREARQGRL